MRLFRAPRILKWLFPSRTWGFSVQDRSIFLTFDDGPQPEVTTWVLDVLKQNNVKATFFCVGNCARQNPEIMDRILSEGHAVGNHTMNHERGTVTSVNEYLNSINQASEYVRSGLFRPPYGRITRAQEEALLKQNFRIIMWTWLSYDFDPAIKDETILAQTEKVKSGDVLVFHDNLKTFERLQRILPDVILELKSKGFNFSVIN
jgi:peptidoglycan-N-acetylglucosamine deacetylase